MSERKTFYDALYQAANGPEPADQPRAVLIWMTGDGRVMAWIGENVPEVSSHVEAIRKILESH